MYSVVLFQNSGFNAVNIPDSPELLNSVARIEVDGVEILQQRFLTSVNVRAKWEAVENVDYAKIGDFYYFVTGVAMLSGETAQLALTPDFITSAGGVKDNNNLVILDGITERQTVSSDAWGAYSEDDPLTQPQQPLVLETTWGDAPERTDKAIANVDGDAIFVESTLDLTQQAIHQVGKTYTDTLTNETVTVPQTYGLAGNNTKFEIGLQSDIGSDRTSVTNGTKVYCANDTTSAISGDITARNVATTVNVGIAAARALGIEGGIISQWRVPQKYLGDMVTVYTYEAGDETATTVNAGTDGDFQVIGGNEGDCTTKTTITPKYGTVKNLRCLYGEYNRYGIMTASGNSMECKPEEIGDGDAQPGIYFVADPRPDGCPYYRFKTINGDSEFWRNCIAGERWADVPFVYQGASGTALNRIKFENQQGLATLNYGNAVTQSALDYAGQSASIANQRALLENDQNFGLAERLLSAFAGGAIGAAGGNTYGTMGSTANQATGAGTWAANWQVNSAYLQQQQNNLQRSYLTGNDILYNTYSATRANELSDLYQANTIWTPTIVFPYNASIIRDVKGNGFLLYKYRYSDADLARIDKLLTMYGYKETEPLTKANFNRRTKFDYVACSSVSVSGFPRWFNEGIATQLKVGVRVWHVLPSVDAYNDNPINS